MITFEVTAPKNVSATLYYRRDEYSFYTETLEGGFGISIAVNEVQLFLNVDGLVVDVSGYCPQGGWKPTQLSPPKYTRAGLRVSNLVVNIEKTGMAYGISDSEVRWPAYVNTDGWVCIGNPNDSGDQAIEFIPCSVAVLKGDSLVALWLHPIMV